MRNPATNPNATKRCITCHQDKPITSFLPSNFVVGGRTDRCLDCIREIARRDRQRRAARMAARGHFHIRKPRSSLSTENA